MFRNKKLTGSRYLLAIATSALVILCALGLFNGVVDPFGRFGWVQITGFNQLKPGFDRNPLLSKAFHSASQHPDSVVIGTSRANQGYDPRNEPWQAVAERPYNLGTPAADIYRIKRYFQHIHARSDVRQLILALDFRSFNAYSQSFANNQAIDTGEDYLSVDASGNFKPSYLVSQVMPSLFSKDALLGSFYTLNHQSVTLDQTYFPNGFKYRNPKTFTPRRRFLNGAGRSVEVYLARPNPRQAFNYSFFDETTGYSTLEDYRQILRIAYENDIDVRIVINPSHAYLLEVIHAVDLWKTFEDWKRSLVAINVEEAEAARATPFPVWDFCTYHPLTTQSIPEKRQQWDHTPQLFWEITHFKPTLGDRVLQTIFSDAPQDSESQESESQDFGASLTPDSIEKHLQTVRDRRTAYVSSHRAEASQVKRRSVRALEKLRDSERVRAQ
ncbi:MAG: hypothetical protein WBA57_10460 [Elainellaceae cyanobacterium]